ncbi:hypothetical protein CBF29_06905 [Vagococcus elongatus]|uniref:Uncharacterized protein n=1 Tax=Vagococcus elongatus TaxID=180344 RepID=A0A430AW98_9ENTE|nr:hypothetical protein CBF29_06905 [Vagococcus elongatus]
MFTKDVLQEMSSTLANVPIVGYIKQEDDGSEDFDNHKTKIVIKDGKVDVAYLGHAYGFIPEKNNAKFEIRSGKEWLTAEGYIWTKFRDSVSILLDGGGTKSQSMEIEVFDSYLDDQGRVNYTDARFSGLCILGDDVPPGMTGSTIEVFNKRIDLFSQVQEMIADFSKLEEGNKLLVENEDLKENEDFAKGSKKNADAGADVKDAKDVKDTDVKDSDPKDDPKEDVEPKDGDKDPKDDNKDPKDSKKDKKSKKANFAISHEETRNQLRELIRTEVADKDSYIYICQIFDTYAVAQIEDYSEETGFKAKHVMYEYTKDNDSVSLGASKEVVPTFLTKEEMAKIDSGREELKQIKEKLSMYENAEKEAKVSEFEEVLGDKADDIRAKFSEMSIDEVEKEVGFSCFQISQNEKEASKGVVVEAVSFSDNGVDAASKEYGSLGAYFRKK